MLTYIGSLPLSALCPVVFTSIGAVSITLNAALQGSLALHASLQASPPTLATTLAASAQFTANLNVASLLSLPALSFSVSDCVTLTAQLNAALSLLVVLEGLLSAAAGIFSYGYAGIANAIGAAVTSELATQWPDGTRTTGNATAVLFGAALLASVTPPNIAQTQLAAFLGGLPFGGGLLYGGKLDLAHLSIVTAGAVGQGRAAIQGQLAAAAALQASIQLHTYAEMIAGQLKFAANLKAIPSVQFALDACLAIAAKLPALLCRLGAALERFDATLFVYSYTGAANALGSAISTALATTWGDGTTLTTGECTAAILGAVDSLSVTTMSAFFGGAF